MVDIMFSNQENKMFEVIIIELIQIATTRSRELGGSLFGEIA